MNIFKVNYKINGVHQHVIFTYVKYTDFEGGLGWVWFGFKRKVIINRSYNKS